MTSRWKFLLSFFLAALFLNAQEAAPPKDEPLQDRSIPLPADPATETPALPPVEVPEERSHDEWKNERWQNRHRDPIVRIHGSVHIKEGETVGDIVVIGGKLNIEGEVRGSVVAVATDANINGKVTQGVVIVPGPAIFGPKADIRDETVVVGSYTLDPAAKFQRTFTPVEIPEMVPVITGIKDFAFKGLFMMRPLPPSVPWVWYVHGGIFLGLLGLTLLFPKPVRYGAEAIADRPVMSMFSGFLTVILFVPVLALISLTVIGLPVGILALVFATLFGKAALMTFLGQQIGRNLSLNFLESPVVAMVVGALVLTALYMVPVVGLIVWGIATLLGIGAIMVATASALNNRPSVPTPVTPISNVPPMASATAAAVAPMTPSSETASLPTSSVYKRVGFWKRTFAAILDLLLLLVPMVLAGGVFPGFAPLILITYFVAMWTWRGTTIGMICLGLKIVRTDGAEIDFAVALVRSLAACFSFVVLFLGFFWAGWDREKQSWHDKIAGTIIIQVPKGVSLL